MVLRLVETQSQVHRVAQGGSGGLVKEPPPITPLQRRQQDRQQMLLERWYAREGISRTLQHDIGRLPHAGKLLVQDVAQGMLATLYRYRENLDFGILRQHDDEYDQVLLGIRACKNGVEYPGCSVRMFMRGQSSALDEYDELPARRLCKSTLDYDMVYLREFWRDQMKRACNEYEVSESVRDQAFRLVNDILMSTLRRWATGHRHGPHLRVVK